MENLELNSLLAEIDDLKKRLDVLRPLDNESISEALAVEYTYESNRIEGNTLTLRETDLVIHKGLTVAGKSMREHLEAINHYEAVLFLRELVQQATPLTESLVKQLHAIVLHSIDREKAGLYRSVPVSISGSRHIPPQPWQVPSLMEDCFRFYEEQRQVLHPVILAAEMHERIVTIHPFVDGNGRTVRLVMNLILLQHGYPIANIPGETESRLAYYHALEIGGDKEEFHRLIAGYVLASARQGLKVVGDAQ
ncbi:MAG: filamentation induced by cAMP protein [Geobacteraceae bacterium]|nr:MAG: filamentation induced by cAMP protein [Geobacteraceae bacterium]